jgi:hypothetical protein
MLLSSTSLAESLQHLDAAIVGESDIGVSDPTDVAIQRQQQMHGLPCERNVQYKQLVERGTNLGSIRHGRCFRKRNIRCASDDIVMQNLGLRLVVAKRLLAIQHLIEDDAC